MGPADKIPWIKRPRRGFEDVLALPLIQLFLRGEIRDEIVLLFGRQRCIAISRSEEGHRDALSDQAARLRFDRLVDSADRLVLKRHRMLDAEDTVLRLGARADFDQLLHAVGARNKGIDQVAIERIGCARRLFKVMRSSASPFSNCRGSWRLVPSLRASSPEELRAPAGGAYPPLRWTRNLPRRAVWLQSAIELFQAEISEFAAHDKINIVNASYMTSIILSNIVYLTRYRLSNLRLSIDY